MGKSVHLTETEWVGIAAFLGAAGVQIAGSAIPHWVGWLLLVIAAYIAISSAHRRIKAKQHDDEMSATDVLKRIAFESEWAVTRDFSSPADHWQETMWEVPLGREFLRPLASGDIVARGIRSTKEGEEYGHSDIPADFWRNAKLEPHADRLMCEPGYDYIFGEGVMYGDIRLRKADVDRLWPARSKSQMQSRPSPFIEKAEDLETAT